MAGLVSWGSSCGHEKLPGVYSHILYFKPWILSSLAHDDNVSSSTQMSLVIQVRDRDELFYLCMPVLSKKF